MLLPHLFTWTVVALATAGVILRPFGWPEAIWAVAGAAVLVALRFLGPGDAWTGIGKGADVYLFLIGMMVLSEVARQHGLFDWLAAHAARRAAGSPKRLFLLIYAVGALVTVFLSNDATAVVLTPAVAAAARKARVADPLPYLLVCALVANAASYVLPISNPANLVLYGSRMPPLAGWLPRYALPSFAAIVATYAVLHWTQRRAFAGGIATDVDVPNLSCGGRTVALGIAGTAAVLLAASSFGLALGLPTCLAGLATAVATLARERSAPWPVLKGISWSVLPLVAGLFVLVEALDQTGFVAALAGLLRDFVQRSTSEAAWSAGIATALASNLTNNLPAGLVAGQAVALADIPDRVRAAVLIGVDLGPNLSVTGSLATILWLNALRRDGVVVGAWSFFKVGAVVMPPALVLALAAAILVP